MKPQRVFTCRICPRKYTRPGIWCEPCRLWIRQYHVVRMKQLRSECKTPAPDHDERIARLSELAQQGQPLFTPTTESVHQ